MPFVVFRTENSTVQLPSQSPTRILTYGYDAVLLDTRRLLLAQAGYDSESVANPHEFEAALAALKPAYGLLILCHTVPEEEQTTISASVEQTDVPLYRVPALVPPTEFLAHVSGLLR